MNLPYAALHVAAVTQDRAAFHSWAVQSPGNVLDYNVQRLMLRRISGIHGVFDTERSTEVRELRGDSRHSGFAGELITQPSNSSTTSIRQDASQ